MPSSARSYGRGRICGENKVGRLINTKCPNCLKNVQSQLDDIFLTCPECKCKWAATYRDIGLDLDEIDPRPIIMENPNKIVRDNGITRLLPPLDEGVPLSEEIKSTDYKGGLKANLDWIRRGEILLYEDGECPAARPFTNLVILARKTKDYALEIAVCERAKILADMHDRYVEKYGTPSEIRFSQTQVYRVIERLPRAQELLRKAREKDR